MSWHRVSRKYHKWLMLVVGLQFVIWSITGTYMVLLDIDYIHGDTLVAEQVAPLTAEKVNYPIARIYQDYPEAKDLTLTTILGRAIYRFSVVNEQKQHKYMLDAANGQLISPLIKEHAIQIAQSLYTGDKGSIRQVSLITENPPFELNARHLPVWRVDFERFDSPSFYINVDTGELVTKRHSYWRIFDWMFSFHVMDYIEEDASNMLLFITSLIALLASLLGLPLSYYRVIKPITNKPVKPLAKAGRSR